MKRIAYSTAILSSLLLLTALSSCSSTKVPNSESTTPPNTSLSLEAQIIYTLGGPQPVARGTFHLLDSDLLNVELPQPGKVKSVEEFTNNLSSPQQLKLLIMTAQFNKRIKEFSRQRDIDTPDTPTDKKGTVAGIGLLIERMKSDKETASHFIQSATTDFQGRATFENLKVGDYWIIGFTETRGDFAFWNHKITIRPGDNKVLLDQNNALYFR
jgi:hypothetical protein